jgi:hypothetical protein
VPARSWDAPGARTAARVDHAGRSPRSDCISLRKRESLACSILAPPAGFEPAHTAPECNPAYGRYRRNTTGAASSGRVWGAEYPPAGTTFGLLVVLYQRAVGGRCRRVALAGECPLDQWRLLGAQSRTLLDAPVRHSPRLPPESRWGVASSHGRPTLTVPFGLIRISCDGLGSLVRWPARANLRTVSLARYSSRDRFDALALGSQFLYGRVAFPVRLTRAHCRSCSGVREVPYRVAGMMEMVLSPLEV